MTQDPERVGAASGRVPPMAPATRHKLRDYFAIDDHAGAVAFAQSFAGRVLLVLLFAVALAAAKEKWLPMSLAAAAAACAYLPQYRTAVIATATFGALGFGPFWYGLTAIEQAMKQEQITQPTAQHIGYVALFAFFASALAGLELVRRHKTTFVARRPVVALLVGVVGLTVLAATSVLQGLAQVALWAFLNVFTAYIWFLAYALVDQRSRDRSSHLLQLGAFHPFWGSTSTPYGKGAAFLRKTMAKTPQQLAVTQIKGLKLLAWSIVLLYVQKFLTWLLVDELKLPSVRDFQALHAGSHSFSIALGWGSLIWAVTAGALSLAIVGHQVVAVARFAGFRLPRNTCRPLECRTLVEFWNRYYFYFKELLVEFFFMPTFLRTFRNYPRLRVFAATFMAAGVGNATYHFIRDIDVVATMGLWNAVLSFDGYLFYCFMLATGICVSQLRVNLGVKPSDTLLGRLRSFLCVWGFFVSMHVFGDDARIYTLPERLSFMATLFGVN